MEPDPKKYIRVLTWNCRRATQNSHAWKYVQELSPDLMLLQEVSGISSQIKEDFDFRCRSAIGKTGDRQRFGSVVAVRGAITRELPLQSTYDWVNKELELFSGNIMACEVLFERSSPMNVVNVYSPAWPINRSRLKEVDVTAVKLTESRDVWVADLVYEALRSTGLRPQDPWIVGGDFNTSETFDAWKGGPRGNKEYLDKMINLGLTECLRSFKGKLTPTFRNPRGGGHLHQMDHLFVTEELKSRLLSCNTGSQGRVFDQSLSDHLPIIADFSFD